MPRIVRISSGWREAKDLDSALSRDGDPRTSGADTIIFTISPHASLWLDTILSLLTLANQYAAAGIDVQLDFGQHDSKPFGFMDRLGFFDFISDQVTVLPARPLYSRASIYRGNSHGTVEIAPIRFGEPDLDLPRRLTSALEAACAARADVRKLGDAAWTILSELIGNVHLHSGTRLDGFASLQVYPGGKVVRVAVGDSGDGLLSTIRPTLLGRYPHLAAASDSELLVEMFRQGISRFEDRKHGLGLKTCAQKAISFGADLNIRLAQQRILLKPLQGAYQAQVHRQENLPTLDGTQIAFTFRLGS